MRYRLRYLDRQIDLPRGEFAIGRGSTCQLRFDDPVVSRRHVLIRVEGDTATIEDPGSRNGVILNGAVVRVPTPLKDGDRIRVGSVELMVLTVSDRAHETYDMLEQVPAVRVQEEDTGSLLSDKSSPTAPSSLLLEVADKSMAIGRVDDAEWILGKFVDDIGIRLQAGQKVAPETIERTARGALKLAAATRSTDWIDWIFDVYRISARILPGSLIDELHPVLRELRYPASPALHSYVETLKISAGGFGKAERFLIQRVEGLLEVASAN
ncbi:MAG: FHA domain-containing protein [Deltaproteobacteria bacterium]|nr:FHA domain-containing protein [Deltaproteobacteria bacterium]